MVLMPLTTPYLAAHPPMFSSQVSPRDLLKEEDMLMAMEVQLNGVMEPHISPQETALRIFRKGHDNLLYAAVVIDVSVGKEAAPLPRLPWSATCWRAILLVLVPWDEAGTQCIDMRGRRVVSNLQPACQGWCTNLNPGDKLRQLSTNLIQPCAALPSLPPLPTLLRSHSHPCPCCLLPLGHAPAHRCRDTCLDLRRAQPATHRPPPGLCSPVCCWLCKAEPGGEVGGQEPAAGVKGRRAG